MPDVTLAQGGSKPDAEQKSRTPAWTDRILWRPGVGIKQLSYTSANMTASDHKPVVATFGITVGSLLHCVSSSLPSRQKVLQTRCRWSLSEPKCSAP